jgi:hypothetical protein
MGLVSKVVDVLIEFVSAEFMKGAKDLRKVSRPAMFGTMKVNPFLLNQTNKLPFLFWLYSVTRTAEDRSNRD